MTVTIDLASSAGYLIGFFVAVFSVGFMALLFLKIRHLVVSRKYDPADRAALRRRWREIEDMIDVPGSMSLRMAVLEADKLFDHALKSLAFPGDTLGERLKFASYKYPELRKVWWAHKIRNQLAHEATFSLDRGMAKKALRDFRRALTRIGAI